MNETTFRQFKAKSHEMGLNLGQALTLAFQHWTQEQKPKKRFLEWKTCDWGKGTQKTSTDVDSVLYSE